MRAYGGGGNVEPELPGMYGGGGPAVGPGMQVPEGFDWQLDPAGRGGYRTPRERATERLRGLAATVANVAGAPMDVATHAANLLRAGAGYAGRELGLLSPSQMPGLEDPRAVPGTSAWLKRGTPLEGDESDPDYMAGQFAGAIASGPRSPGRAGTPGAVSRAQWPGGGEDLAAYHTTQGLRLGLSRPEITHPSFAITSKEANSYPEIMQAFGRNILVPRPSAIDPLTSPTVIKSHDFYSPRKYQSAEQQMREDWLSRGAASPTAEALARGRLADKFASEYPRGGTLAEGLKYKMEELDPATASMLNTRRFQSLRDFENSPEGAARLRDTPRSPAGDPLAARDLYNQYLASTLRTLRPMVGGEPMNVAIGERLGREMAGPALDRRWWEGVTNEQGKPMLEDPRFEPHLAEMRAMRKYLIDRGPSDYAEAKRYGSFGINPDNVLAYIADTPQEKG